MDKDTLVNLSVPSIAKRPDAQKALAFFTDYLPEGSSLSERHYCLKNSLKARPKCEVCGSEVNFQLGKYNRFCSRKCSIAFYKNDASIKKKISESNKRSAEQAKEKRKETNLKRYGVECTFTTINNDRKAKGLVSPSVSKNADVSSLLSESVLREMHHEKKLNLVEIANELGVTERAIWNRLKMFSIEQMYWGGSSLETRICDFLEGLDVQFKRNYKPDFLQDKEIDIWIPESKLGIEINGLYWHSEHKRPKTYYHDKAKTCLNNGVRLIQFWEHEIIEKEKLVFSMIRNAVGRSEIKLSARDCIVVESTKADRETIRTFLDENHLKGYHHYSRAFLLKNKDGEILSTMTFSKPRFSKSSGLELIRFCSKMNTTIRGGPVNCGNIVHLFLSLI